MAFARTDSLDQRSAILQGLVLRNRMVALLRIIVPAAGAAAFLLLVLQIYVASTLHQYGISAIRIDRGALVVDTPQYSGIGSDGARYSAKAKEARAPLGDPTMIAMTDVALEFSRAGSAAIHIEAETATADTAHNVITIPGTARLRSADGLTGTLNNLRTELQTGLTVAGGAVDLTFASGARLEAADMRYEGNAKRWSFDRVTFTAPGLPEVPR
jgi:lipopolysaccharide export system protein LptC